MAGGVKVSAGSTTADRATTSARTRRLGLPRRVSVQAGDDGRPARVDGQQIDSIRETWLIEDRWWTSRPLRRRYWEVVTTGGRDEVVFHDLRSGRWWRQR